MRARRRPPCGIVSFLAGDRLGSLDPLRTAVEDLFGNPILFVVLNKASGAVSIRAPNAAVILMCLSRDCIRDLASAYGLLLTKCCLMSEEVPRERSLPRHASKVVTFGSTSLLISLNCCLSTLASSEFPPCVGCIFKLYIDNPGAREMGWPILRLRHSTTDFLLCKDGVSSSRLWTLKEWLC